MSEQVVPKGALERVAKCMALSRSSNPSEAALALEHAQRLMAKHGLTSSDLLLQEVSEATCLGTVTRRLARWEIRITHLVARTFRCRHLWAPGLSWATTRRDRMGHHIFIGLRGQTEMAQYCAEVLIRKLRQARQTYKCRRAQADSFCEGWVDAMVSKVRAFAWPEGHKELLDRYVEKTVPVLGQIQERKIQADDFRIGAYFAGRAVGRRETLLRPVGNSSPRTLK